jgi:HEAT repeat protein
MAIPALLAALRDPDVRVREEVVSVLARIGLEDTDTGTTLDDARDDPSLYVRVSVAALIWKRDRNTAAVWPTFLAGFQSDKPMDRAHTAFALAALGPEARAAVPLLALALHDPSSYVRWNVVCCLVHIGPDAKATIPLLIAQLAQSPGIVDGMMTSHALASIGPAAFPALVASLDDVRAEVRVGAAAACAMASFPARSEPPWCALPALRRALNDSHLGVRVHAARAVWQMTCEADAVLPPLVAALSGSDTDLRNCAISALGTMGPAARSALPLVSPFLKDPKAEVRVSAAHAVWCISGTSGDALPILLAGLNSKEDVWIAAHALGELGPEAKAALPALRRLAERSDWFTRQMASEAVARIEGGGQ